MSYVSELILQCSNLSVSEMTQLCNELNNQSKGAGETWAAILLAWDSHRYLQPANTTVSLKAVWWDAQIVCELEIHGSALGKSIWKQWSISGKVHRFVMLHLLPSLGQVGDLALYLLSNEAWHCRHPMLTPSCTSHLYALHQNSSERFAIIICIAQSCQALTIMNLPVL